MTFPDIWMIIPASPALSVLVWFVMFSLLLYMARIQAHSVIRSASNALRNVFRLTANSVRIVEKRLVERNRVVLLAAGREHAERMVEREFERISDTVHQDLAQYPKLQREVSDLLKHIEEDYKASSVTPPPPPSWTKAVEEIAKIPSAGDTMVAKILAEIQKFLIKEHDRAIKEYRKSSQTRHKLLHKMRPVWKRVNTVFNKVDKNIDGVLVRSKAIERHMENYEQISKGTDHAVHMLSSSSMTQFFISTFVLLIAIGGAMINFNLIARPMAEMVGGSAYIMGFRTSDIAALVIIFVEVAMGLFLMESLRITRLFPVIGALEDKKRIQMVWITFGLLFTLASIEAGLAFMRELLSQDEAALIASLVGDQSTAPETISNRWITTAAQMGMGFILPFALTFVAIPLESFINSLRTVIGAVIAFLLGMVVFVLRMTGNFIGYAGTALIHLYDVFIFIPAAVAKLMKKPSAKKKLVFGRESHEV